MRLLHVGITHGDINGISLELITKALGSPELLELCTPVVFSNDACFMKTAELAHLEQPVPLQTIQSAKETIDGRVNLVNACENEPVIEWGVQTETALKAEADSLNAAIDAYKAGFIDILICAPGQLDNDFNSHSLSDFIKQATQSTTPEFDWIINENIRILKLHPIAFTTELGEGFAIEAFKEELNNINRHLRQDFGFIRPRMALISSKPNMDTVIRELEEDGITIFGPFEANSFIEAGNYKHYDAVLFLEEEEGRKKLIDALQREETIGYVSGLPLVLAYPLTGICYDKAGKGIADETPLRNALYTAIDIYRNRVAYQYATQNPLEKQWNPKGRDDFKLDLSKEEE